MASFFFRLKKTKVRAVMHVGTHVKFLNHRRLGDDRVRCVPRSSSVQNARIHCRTLMAEGGGDGTPVWSACVRACDKFARRCHRRASWSMDVHARDYDWKHRLLAVLYTAHALICRGIE